MEGICSVSNRIVLTLFPFLYLFDADLINVSPQKYKKNKFRQVINKSSIKLMCVIPTLDIIWDTCVCFPLKSYLKITILFTNNLLCFYTYPRQLQKLFNDCAIIKQLNRKSNMQKNSIFVGHGVRDIYKSYQLKFIYMTFFRIKQVNSVVLLFLLITWVEAFFEPFATYLAIFINNNKLNTVKINSN